MLITNMDLPLTAARDCPHIELYGNREILIDGCFGIVEYTADYIQLNLGSTVLTLKGDCLFIQNFEGAQVSISGTFLSIEFS